MRISGQPVNPLAIAPIGKTLEKIAVSGKGDAMGIMIC